jgi:hypothetical protein
MAAAPPPAVASSTAARRRGFGFGVANEGPVLPYCLESGVRGKLGLGSWFRQRAHVQPAPRRFGKRDEKVGFSIVLGRGRSWEVFVKHFRLGNASRGLRSLGLDEKPVWSGWRSRSPSAPLPEILKVARCIRDFLGIAPSASGDPGSGVGPPNSI